jgi:crotonobetainyl-CoA:carnitine CoA-transferase CaiB-like acyl-CoA transferase
VGGDEVAARTGVHLNTPDTTPPAPGAALPGAAGRPLAGVKVLDVTRLLPGPLAARHLAEWGADVLKVDEPGIGDPARLMLALPGDAKAGGDSAFYREVNRGKTERRIDLRSAEGRDEFLSLVDDADAVLEGFRPGVMARLGLGWDVLHARNPRLVMASITGYGQQGPFSDRAGHDINYLALSGVLGQCGAADGTLTLANFQIADLLGGTLAATGSVLAALLGAARNGRGQHLDISMTREVWRHAVIARTEGRLWQAMTGRTPGPAQSLLNGGAACYGVYLCADGRHLAVGALEPKFWRAFCEAIGQPAWSARHWSAGELPGTPAARTTRDDVAALLATRPAGDWLAMTDPADCCVTPVLRLDEVRSHPWFDGD